MDVHCASVTGASVHLQGAYKFGKMKFPEFSRTSKQLFADSYKEKTRCNELT